MELTDVLLNHAPRFRINHLKKLGFDPYSVEGLREALDAFTAFRADYHISFGPIGAISTTVFWEERDQFLCHFAEEHISMMGRDFESFFQQACVDSLLDEHQCEELHEILITTGMVAFLYTFTKEFPWDNPKSVIDMHSFNEIESFVGRLLWRQGIADKTYTSTSGQTFSIERNVKGISNAVRLVFLDQVVEEIERNMDGYTNDQK